MLSRRLKPAPATAQAGLIGCRRLPTVRFTPVVMTAVYLADNTNTNNKNNSNSNSNSNKNNTNNSNSINLVVYRSRILDLFECQFKFRIIKITTAFLPPAWCHSIQVRCHGRE